MPSPYRSPITRPFHVTTRAAVIAAAGSKAASTARFTVAMSSAAGIGSSAGSTSPIGHGCVAASGSVLATRTGVKAGASWPRGSVRQP